MTNPARPHDEVEGAAAFARTRSIELERFREYRRTRNQVLRSSLIADGQGIAVGLAKRYKDRGAELDDLIQVAQIGLIQAVERFDPERGVPFIGFATPTILGELRRHFRTVWSVKMPRSLQESTQRLRPIANELQHELGRSATIAEIAERLGTGVEYVLEAMEAGAAFRIRSLDAPLSSGSFSSSLASTIADDHSSKAFSQVEARETVNRLLPLLNSRSRRIVELRFFENRSQTQIADELGMSQMHVSRLLKQAIEELKLLCLEDTDSG
jgi:RNA polymerase sigma-B factor